MTNDAYHWRIVYQDGSELNEYDDVRPDGRGFAERDAKPIAAIMLLPVEHWSFAHAVQVPVDAEPIFFRRRAAIINTGTEAMQSGTLAHCIGWQRDNDEAAYLFAFDDGSTLLTDYLQAI